MTLFTNPLKFDIVKLNYIESPVQMGWIGYEYAS